MAKAAEQAEQLGDLTADEIKSHLPAPVAAGGEVAVASEWDELRAEFDDGSQAFRDHFGLSVPRLRTDFGKNGQGWVDDLSGQSYRDLEFVILAYPPSRAWWEVSIDEGGGGTPDCRSHDMVIPDPTSPNRQSDTCKSCPHSKWGDANERPACAESVNVVAYDIIEDRYVWLRFGGTALKPFNQWISYLTSKRLASFQVTTRATLESREDGAKKWLVPKFSLGVELTPADVRPMREMAKAAMAAYQQVADEMAEAEAKAGPFDDDRAVDGEVVDPDREPF